MQPDLFEKTIEGKIEYLERRMAQMTKEIWFLKQVYFMKKREEKIDDVKRAIDQLQLFGT